MKELIFWSILSYGLMNIVVFSSICAGVRDGVTALKITFSGQANFILSGLYRFFNFLDEMIRCPMCFGFWGGLLLSLLIYSPSVNILGTPTSHSWFIDAIYSSGVVWLINGIIEWFEENRVKFSPSEEVEH